MALSGHGCPLLTGISFSTISVLLDELLHDIVFLLTIDHLSVRLIWHFDLKKFRPNEVPRVKISLVCVFAFMAIGWPLIILKSGPAGWFKFWFMPWMVYHFWVTFLIFHHHCWNAHSVQVHDNYYYYHALTLFKCL